MAKLAIGQEIKWGGEVYKITHISSQNICIKNLTHADGESKQVHMQTLLDEYEKGMLHFGQQKVNFKKVIDPIPLLKHEKGEKTHTTFLEPLVENAMQKVFDRYEHVPEEFTFKLLYDEVLSELQEYNKANSTSHKVSYSTIRRRWIAKEPYEPYYRYKSRYVSDVEYQNQGFNQSGIYTTEPLVRVEADYKIIDTIVVDEKGQVLGRPTITILLDSATRSVLGFHVGMEPGSTTTVLNSLKHANQRKTYVKEKYPHKRL